MRVLSLLTLPLAASAFMVSPVQTRRASTITMAVEKGASRRDIIRTTGAGLASLALFPLLNRVAPANAASEVTLPSGLKYTVIESGNGPTPNVGELAAIRFTGAYKGTVYDDLYKTAEPLYFRVGGETLLKGIEEAVKLMKVGDRWKLTIPGELAFGKKGRSASAGKPRIPPFAEVEYDLKLVALPGREPELLDLANFDENAPASDDSVVPGQRGFY